MSVNSWNCSARTAHIQPNHQAFHQCGSLHYYMGGGYAASSQHDTDRQLRLYSVVLNIHYTVKEATRRGRPTSSWDTKRVAGSISAPLFQSVGCQRILGAHRLLHLRHEGLSPYKPTWAKSCQLMIGMRPEAALLIRTATVMCQPPRTVSTMARVSTASVTLRAAGITGWA